MTRYFQRIAILLLLIISPLQGHTKQNADSKINLFKDTVEAIGAAGDAIAKITDGIKHLVITGVEGYNYVSEERKRDRLIGFSATSTSLGLSQVVLAQSIDDYLENKDPTERDWREVMEGIYGVKMRIHSVLSQFENERSDFVLEKAYSKLISTLVLRGNLLDKITRLPAPSTDEEREQLILMNEQYKRLLVNFNDAISNLNAYIKQKNSTQ